MKPATMAADVIPIITKLRSYRGMIRMASRRAVAGASMTTRPQVGSGTLQAQNKRHKEQPCEQTSTVLKHGPNTLRAGKPRQCAVLLHQNTG